MGSIFIRWSACYETGVQVCLIQNIKPGVNYCSIQNIPKMINSCLNRFIGIVIVHMKIESSYNISNLLTFCGVQRFETFLCWFLDHVWCIDPEVELVFLKDVFLLLLWIKCKLVVFVTETVCNSPSLFIVLALRQWTMCCLRVEWGLWAVVMLCFTYTLWSLSEMPWI